MKLSVSFSLLNYNYNDPRYNYGNNAGLFPTFGWAIKKDLLLGIRGIAGYGHTVSKSSSGDKSEENSLNFGAGLFLKKYKLLKDRFGFYLNNEITGIYVENNQEQTYAGSSSSSESHSWGAGYSFKLGVFYKFSENFLGEGSIGGVDASYYPSGDVKSFAISASFLQYFNLGINYRF